jgi:hypothetical protein
MILFAMKQPVRIGGASEYSELVCRAAPFSVGGVDAPAQVRVGDSAREEDEEGREGLILPD